MKTALLGGVVFCGVLVGVVNPVKLGAERLRYFNAACAASASLAKQNVEEIHAALVDIPCVIDMSHASPDTWDNLPPPVDPFGQLPAPAPPPDENDMPDAMSGPISLAAN